MYTKFYICPVMIQGEDGVEGEGGGDHYWQNIRDDVVERLSADMKFFSSPKSGQIKHHMSCELWPIHSRAHTK